MPYKVTIIKIDKDVPFTNTEYKYTGKKDDDGDKIYEHVPFPDTKDVETQVFEQTVDELNVSDVVAVVNGVSGKDL